MGVKVAGCIIGNGTTIDVNSVISHSIIGENVNIDKTHQLVNWFWILYE